MSKLFIIVHASLQLRPLYLDLFQSTGCPPPESLSYVFHLVPIFKLYQGYILHSRNIKNGKHSVTLF